MTTQNSLSASEQQRQRSRSKREQVLIACKVCRGRKTKCSGEKPQCQQCKMRDQVCEWESLNEEAPRLAKRRFQALEQRSASEHELLAHLRTLSETDCMSLTRRLREGCHIDALLVFARKLSNVPLSERMVVEVQQPNDQSHAAVPSVGLDSNSDPIAEKVEPSARPTLPPIASIWYSPKHPAGPIVSPTASGTIVTLSDRKKPGGSISQNQAVSSTSLYDRWMSQV